MPLPSPELAPFPPDRGSPPSHRCTRRQALQGAGVALLGAGLLAAPRAARANAAAALDPTRAAALAALLAALAHGPAAGLDAAEYSARFDAYYADAPTPYRAYFDQTLDALAAEPALMGAESRDAYALLSTWAAEPPRQRLVASALDVASLSFEEDEFKNPRYGLVTGAVA